MPQLWGGRRTSLVVFELKVCGLPMKPGTHKCPQIVYVLWLFCACQQFLPHIQGKTVQMLINNTTAVFLCEQTRACKIRRFPSGVSQAVGLVHLEFGHSLGTTPVRGSEWPGWLSYQVLQCRPWIVPQHEHSSVGILYRGFRAHRSVVTVKRRCSWFCSRMGHSTGSILDIFSCFHGAHMFPQSFSSSSKIRAELSSSLKPGWDRQSIQTSANYPLAKLYY